MKLSLQWLLLKDQRNERGAVYLIVPRRRAKMIKKVKDGYQVLSEKTGKNLGGPYKTLEEAKKRLRQVEFFKHQRG